MKLDFVDTDRIIFQSPNLVAIFSPVIGNPRHLLTVSFMAIMDDNAPRNGLSRDTLRDHAIPTIHVMAAHNHWYQYPEMPEMLDVIRRFGQAYAETVTYGLSMGAYAAIHASGPLNAVRSVAFAPQFTVDSRKVFFEPGWQQYVADVNFIWDDFAANASATASHYIVYDPLFTDRLHFREIEQRVPVIPVPIPFGGHHIWLPFIHAGAGGQAFVDMILGRYDVLAMRRSLRAARATNPHYWAMMAQNAPRWRSTAVKRGLALNPQDSEVRGILEKYAIAEAGLARSDI